MVTLPLMHSPNTHLTLSLLTKPPSPSINLPYSCSLLTTAPLLIILYLFPYHQQNPLTHIPYSRPLPYSSSYTSLPLPSINPPYSPSLPSRYLPLLMIVTHHVTHPNRDIPTQRLTDSYRCVFLLIFWSFFVVVVIVFTVKTISKT